MADTEWFNAIKTAEKIVLNGENARKIHYKFKNGKEMVEEYNLDTGVLSKRAWKSNTGIRKNDKWQVEVGDQFKEIQGDDPIESIGIKESEDSPYVVHRVTKTKLEWRIRNLPYDLECYNVTVDAKEKNIVVRTTNNKFFKKIPILELQRLNLTPQQSALKYSHYMNTLILSYDKPVELIQFDKRVAEELKTVRVIEDGELGCKPS